MSGEYGNQPQEKSGKGYGQKDENEKRFGQNQKGQGQDQKGWQEKDKDEYKPSQNR